MWKQTFIHEKQNYHKIPEVSPGLIYLLNTPFRWAYLSGKGGGYGGLIYRRVLGGLGLELGSWTEIYISLNLSVSNSWTG